MTIPLSNPLSTTETVLIGLLLLVAAIAACSNSKAKQGPRVVAVRAGEVLQQNVPVQVLAIGNVEASNTVSVKALVGGEVTNVYFKEGQDLKKGDLLAALFVAEAPEGPDGVGIGRTYGGRGGDTGGPDHRPRRQPVIAELDTVRIDAGNPPPNPDGDTEALKLQSRLLRFDTALCSLQLRPLRERMRANPLVKDKDAWRRERPFRAAVIEQCTYDGTIHDAEWIVKKIGHLCDYILFDEAWAGFMKFHPLYERRYAMGLKDLTEASPGSASGGCGAHLRDIGRKGGWSE